MSWSLDARIPLRILAPEALAAALEGAGSFALLMPEDRDDATGPAAAVARFAPAGPAHAAACSCCGGRPPVGAALDRLFQARVRGGCAWFGQVLAVVPDAATRQLVESVLASDPLTAARFRLG